jgi:beta-lactam-binding protein with PASTA domain
MSIFSRSISALGKLVILIVLLAAFLSGMVGVVYMSLSGSVITVPEIVGKDFVQSEKELAALGLKIRKRADRVSDQQINTVLEQLPRAGETVKSGQWISVVVSKAGGAGEETPSSLKKDIEEDDTEKIEEMISDKPKKSKTNSNTNKKKADTTRDVIANESSTNTSTDTKETTTPKETEGEKKETEKGTDKPTAPKPQVTPATKPPAERPEQ